MAFDNPDVNAADAGGINPQPQDDSQGQQAPSQAAPAAAPQNPQNGQPQNPQQPAAQQPQTAPGQPMATKDLFHHLSHAFIGSALSNLAKGFDNPATYSVDENGKTVATKPPSSSGDRLRNFASAALMGLAAGASAPKSASKAGSALSGLGAGAVAVQQAAQQKDAASRKQAGDDYEQEQRTMLQKHNIAVSNLNMFSVFNHDLENGNDHDPERQNSIALKAAAEEAGLRPVTMSSTELEHRVKTDPNFLATHFIRAAGHVPTMVDGKQTTDANGVPQSEGQVIVFDGSQDGKITPPASWFSDAKKYGKAGGITDADSLDPKTPISLEDFALMESKISTAKKAAAAAGWKPYGTADSDSPVGERNPVTNETRPYPLDANGKPVIPADAAEAWAKAKKDNADANKKDNTGEVTPALRYTQEQENHRAEIKARLDSKDQNLGKSYETQNREFDTIRKPLDTSLGAFSTLRSSLDEGTAAGDSVVAPALLKALVAGGGVRITQAEISNFTHGRSTLEDMKGYLQKLQSGKSITPEQRKQVYSLLGAVESKTRQKSDILAQGQEAIDTATTVAEQRKAVRDVRTQLDAVDRGESKPQNGQGAQNPAAKTPDTHVFDLAAYMKANPKADAQAIAKQMIAKGYEVKQ